MGDYKLYSEDNSLVSKYLNRFTESVADLLSKKVPFQVIYIMPILFLFSGFASLFIYSINQFWFVPLIAVGYIVLNSIAQQYVHKRKKASIATELLDALLGVISLGVFSLLFEGLFATKSWTFLIFVSIGLLANSLTYYQQFKTGKLSTLRLGKQEVMIVLAGIILLSNIPEAYEYYHLTIGSYILFDFVLILFSFAIVVSMVRVLVRLQNVTYGIWLFFAAMLIIMIFCLLTLTLTQSIIVLTLYTALYCIKLKTATLLDGLERSTGLFTPVVLIASYFMQSLYPTNTFIIITAYLGFSLIMFCYKSRKMMQQSSE